MQLPAQLSTRHNTLGASGESKRDIGKLRDEAGKPQFAQIQVHEIALSLTNIGEEVNNLTVKSAAHDVDIGKNSDDLRKLERQRVEET